jgi:glutamate/aspartate transport system substrate-binding protein
MGEWAIARPLAVPSCEYGRHQGGRLTKPRAISDKQHLGIKFMVGNDHAESFAMLKEGKADAFATDDILLYGLVATARLGDQYHVVGEYLSYDPYGLM